MHVSSNRPVSEDEEKLMMYSPGGPFIMVAPVVTSWAVAGQRMVFLHMYLQTRVTLKAFPVATPRGRSLSSHEGELSFSSHVKAVTKSAYYHLKNIARIRCFVSSQDLEKLVHAFITSRVDYCNGLLTGLPRKTIRQLQLIQNAAARILTRTRKSEHITPVLRSLHWLPVTFRIDFKVLLLVYKSLNGLGPKYIADMLTEYKPNRPLRSGVPKLVPGASPTLHILHVSFINHT